MKRHEQTVRLISGQWRRRLLRFPAEEGLRPTPDIVRERVFNWLGQSLDGWHCLDIFAGSGALGFEAASRGAAHTIFLERNRTACQALHTNRDLLAASQTDIICTDALTWLRQQTAAHGDTKNSIRFDLIFVDPPYASALQTEVLHQLPPLLAPKGIVYIEHDGSFVPPAGWNVHRDGRTGQSHYLLLEQETP